MKLSRMRSVVGVARMGEKTEMHTTFGRGGGDPDDPARLARPGRLRARRTGRPAWRRRAPGANRRPGALPGFLGLDL